MGEALLEICNSLLEEGNLMLEVLNWIEDAGWMLNRLAISLSAASRPAGIYSAADLTDIIIQDSLLIKF